MGNLLAVVVHAANIHDTKAGILAAQPACDRYPTLKGFCADAGYRGTFVRELGERFALAVDISEKIKPHEWGKAAVEMGGGTHFRLAQSLPTAQQGL